MTSCERLRPVLFRALDEEGSPDDALRAARHLSSCTACRILVARERRLREALEAMPDVPVDEGFLAAVMDALPATPPPPPIGAAARRRAWLLRKRARFGAIAVASLAAGAAAAHLARLLLWPGSAGSLSFVERSDTSTSAVGALVAALATSLEKLSHGGPLGVTLPSWPVLAVGPVPLAAGLAAIGALMLLAARGALRHRAAPLS